MSAVEASGKILLDADAISRTLSRIAHEIIEANPDLGQVALVGIQTRGVPIACASAASAWRAQSDPWG